MISWVRSVRGQIDVLSADFCVVMVFSKEKKNVMMAQKIAIPSLTDAELAARKPLAVMV